MLIRCPSTSSDADRLRPMVAFQLIASSGQSRKARPTCVIMIRLDRSLYPRHKRLEHRRNAADRGAGCAASCALARPAEASAHTSDSFRMAQGQRCAPWAKRRKTGIDSAAPTIALIGPVAGSVAGVTQGSRAMPATSIPVPGKRGPQNLQGNRRRPVGNRDLRRSRQSPCSASRIDVGDRRSAPNSRRCTGARAINRSTCFSPIEPGARTRDSLH